ncbi:hypothetical protein P22_2096 [Propionispora sp. 2/2-37]|uniref:hypothetical protein n=1 Tax=Propionispora sp. 2/2-37 TaxID=1677858 RepID=UPI0006C72D0B|nr:hypothetical protein [Propionispora sp. 2/2-37]CUH96008.1 hypothetical protein P22_2096 [Propionispora sp. 2/2-37]
MKISISDEIKTLCPGTALGFLHYKITVESSSAKLFDIFDSSIAKLSEGYTLDAIVKIRISRLPVRHIRRLESHPMSTVMRQKPC